MQNCIEQLKRCIFHFQSMPSTQLYAIATLKSGQLFAPFCIYADIQTDGIGSRGNRWESVKKALTFSFVLPLDVLPQDLSLESSAIFFGVIMRCYLVSLGSKVWLKYPNDLYLGDSKIGGILTQKIDKNIVCGIGINLNVTKHSSIANANDLNPAFPLYASLESTISDKVDSMGFLCEFFTSFKNFTSWKQIFSIYALEFHKNDSFCFHYDNRIISLRDTTLNEDGSLEFEGKRIFSLR